MPQIQVTYYTGNWSQDDRVEVRAALEGAGFEVSEDEGTVKGGPVELSQLIVDVVGILGVAATTVALINGLLDLYDRVRRRKRDDGNIQAYAPQRIYIVPLVLGESGSDAIKAIPADFADGNDERRGDMTWRDERWKTVEELHDRPARRQPPAAAGHGSGHRREGVARVRRGRKGRRGQAR